MSEPAPAKRDPSSGMTVAKASGIMVLSLLLSRVLGLVRDAVFAGKFGSDSSTDAYTLAFQVPDLMFFLIAGGALSSAFIPVFSEYLHTDREDEAWHVFSSVTTLMSLIVGGFIVVAMVFTEPLVMLTAPGKIDDPGLVPLIAHMSRIVLPAQFAFFIGGLMFGTLYARRVFAVPGLGPNIYNIGIIFGALALSSFFVPGVIGMSWGALIGAVTGNLVIPFFAMRAVGAQYHWSLDTRHPGVRKVFKLMVPVVLGLSLPGVYALVMQIFASYYEVGVNTWLNFSNKLMQAPLGVFGQSLAIAVFPVLSQFFAQQKLDLFRNQLNSTLRTVVYLTVPVAVLMFVMAEPITAALYQHGEFTARDTEQVAACLRLFALGIPAWCLHPVLMRAFFSIHNTVTPIILGTLTTAIFVVLVFSLRETPLRYQALPLASSISAIFLVLLLGLGVDRNIGGLNWQGLGVTLVKSVAGAVPLGAVAGLGVYTPVAELMDSKIAILLGVGLISLAAAWVYYFATKALGMPETSYISRAMGRFNRRKPPPAGDDPLEEAT